MNDKRKNNKKNETPVLILTAAVLAVTVIAAVILSSVLTGMHGGEGTAGQPATTGDPTETAPVTTAAGTTGQPATDKDTTEEPSATISPATAEEPARTSAPATPGSSAGTSSPVTEDSKYTTSSEGPATAGTTASQETKAEPDEITSQVTTEVPEDTGERSETGYNADTSVPATASGQDETAGTPDITEALTSGITTGTTSQETSVTPVDTTSPVTTSPVTTARPVETTSPVTTKKPTETSAPVTTAKPVETTSPADADYPVWGYEPAVPSGHIHSYKASETLEPTCEYGGYTLEKCSCGSTRMTGLTAKTGHTLQHAAYRLEPGELTADSLVMHVSFCGKCFKFFNEKTMLSDLGCYGIYAGRVLDSADDVCFETEGQSYPYAGHMLDMTTHVCPSMPSVQCPVTKADISKLPKLHIPDISSNDKNSYPFSAVMRDGSVINACWSKTGNGFAPSVIKDSLNIDVGNCGWGWSYDSYYKVWVLGVWYHPQVNTWYFKMYDTDPRFS